MSPDAYLLDTVLVSELVKRTPNLSAIAWVNAQNEDRLFISTITLGEIQKGQTAGFREEGHVAVLAQP